MTIRLGKYLCGVSLVLFTLFVFGHVRADCGCEYYGYDQDMYNQCMNNCSNQGQQQQQEQQKQEQQGGVGCGESPYCCDGSPSSIQCDSIPVVTPCPDGCCGIKLNTNFPIIGNCIESANATGAFPAMMSALTKIVMSLILVICFIAIIVAGVLWASAGEDSGKTKTAREIIEKVAITILLLGFSGVILRLVNPNFFG